MSDDYEAHDNYEYEYDEREDQAAAAAAHPIILQAEASAQTTHHAHSEDPTPMRPVSASDMLGSPTATATAAWALSNLCNAPNTSNHAFTALNQQQQHQQQPYNASFHSSYAVPSPAAAAPHWTPYSQSYPGLPKSSPPVVGYNPSVTFRPSHHRESPTFYSNYPPASYDQATPQHRSPERWHSIPSAGSSSYRRPPLKLPTILNRQPSPPTTMQQQHLQPPPTYTPPFTTDPLAPSPSMQAPSKRKADPQPLVTPTPSKRTQTDYSRKTKSLGLLCENFITRDWQDGILSIDEAAKELQVERRRIYDIVNILESLQVVTKLHKNTYQWKGLLGLEPMMSILQEEALVDFADLAHQFGLLSEPSRVSPTTTTTTEADAGKKSLGKLSRQFLQLFLVGYPQLSLHEASDLILGVSTVEDLSRMGGAGTLASPKTSKAAATKGLKTKIRRLYDIANILCSLGLVRKLEGHRSKHVFVWAYSKSVKDLQAEAVAAKKQKQSMLSPKTHEVSRVLASMLPFATKSATPALPRSVTMEAPVAASPTQHNVLANIHEHGARETPRRAAGHEERE